MRTFATPSVKGDLPWGPVESMEFSVAGSKYGVDKAVGLALDAGKGLSTEPVYNLEKPLLLVHGFLGHGRQFGSLAEHLTRDGHNGGQAIYVKKGELFRDPECTQAAQACAEHRVFYMVHEREASPEVIADDIKLASEAMAASGHSDGFDVAAHSLGGVGARIFCDRGNKVGKLAMVGTPNKGSRAARLTEAALKNDISWATTLAGVSAAALPALSWMTPVVNGNEKLEQLNNRWSLQEQNTQGAIVIGAKDFKTPHPVETWGEGDGLIDAGSLGVGDVKVKMLGGTGRLSHYTMMNDPDVYKSLASFFGWEPAA